MVSENAEDYLACVYVLSQADAPVKTTAIAEKLDLTPASVTEMSQKLAAEGYLNYEKYKGVTLTPKGRKLAERIKRRHRLLERFLVDVLGMSKEESHDVAMRLEHTFTDDTVERLSKIMNDPKVCPDGDPIPPAEGPVDVDLQLTVPLSDLEEGEKGQITHLTCSDPTKIRRLISMGFVPGRMLTLEERVPLGGPLLVRIEEMRVALARDFASLVQVQRGT
jgi:DtxR family Mn-dependent transcriptional regulator